MSVVGLLAYIVIPAAFVEKASDGLEDALLIEGTDVHVLLAWLKCTREPLLCAWCCSGLGHIHVSTDGGTARWSGIRAALSLPFRRFKVPNPVAFETPFAGCS